MSDNNYVLAMYDIRGKQDFIYRSSKMKEIIGASYMNSQNHDVLTDLVRVLQDAEKEKK